MADEFPTLEVALAALSPWLAFRGFVLGRSALRARADLARLGAALERAAPGRVGDSLRGLQASWLSPLWRAAAHGGAEADAELRHHLEERSAHLGQQLRSAAARDLVVCAVLTGALGYARISSLGVEDWFYGFGLANAGLILLAVGFRLRMARELAAGTARLLSAVTARRSPSLGDATSGRCRVCGETKLARLTTPAELGSALTELGVELVTVCAKCGHVSGRARGRD